MKLFVLAILVLLLVGMTDARMPVKGDQIKTIVLVGSGAMKYEGTVEEIGNGLLCMNCVSSQNIDQSEIPDYGPYDVCLGIGNIVQIRW